MGKLKNYVENVRETGKAARDAQAAFEDESDRRYRTNGSRPMSDDDYPVEHHHAAEAADRAHRDAIRGH